VFEVVKTARGYATTPTVLVSFCAQTNCTDGSVPTAGLILDAAGNIFGMTAFGGANDEGTVFEIAKTASGYAGTPTVLVSFCAQTNCTDGSEPEGSLIADAAGNLFGTTGGGGANGFGTVFEISKTASGYASTATALVSFDGTNGSVPTAGPIADAVGNLFGTTGFGGANNAGTVFRLARTASGYARTPTVLVSFCAQTNCTDGANPFAGLIADAGGNLLGTTFSGGLSGNGTVFEVGGSGFVVPAAFDGRPGAPNCRGKSVSALAHKYHGLAAAAAALGYSSVAVLKNAITTFCTR
jgi:uncharacterized repeat protein (TIGR03803 family)